MSRGKAPDLDRLTSEHLQYSHALLKPNSITLAASEPAPNQLRTSCQHVRSQLRTSQRNGIWLLPDMLSKLFNLMMHNGYVPRKFGQSYTVPIPKSSPIIIGLLELIDNVTIGYSAYA